MSALSLADMTGLGCPADKASKVLEMLNKAGITKEEMTGVRAAEVIKAALYYLSHNEKGEPV